MAEHVVTVNHLFLYCRITGQLWRLLLNFRGKAWSMPGKITGALISWEQAELLDKKRGRWRIVPASIWSTIWKERNFRCFESIENNMQQIKLK